MSHSYVVWQKKKLFRLSRSLIVSDAGLKAGWTDAKKYEGIKPAVYTSKWGYVAAKLNPWWVNVVMDGCTQSSWETMRKELELGFGKDAALEFKEIFPQKETVGGGKQSSLQKKIYALGNKRSNKPDTDLFEDVFDIVAGN